MTEIVAEMAATVLEVRVSTGDRVEAGQEIVLVESMKMEIPVAAPIPGVVARVAVASGDLVSVGDVLVELSAGQ